MATSDSVLVVGGGLAGLTAARRLALDGAEVTVLEASDTLGGQLARHTVGGIALDAGAEAFATRGGTVADLATALGLGDDVVAPADAAAWLYRADGSAIALPATSLLGIPGYPLAADVVAVIGKRAAWRAELDILMLGQVGSRATTLGELVRRRMGRGVLDGLVAPVVRGVHSVDPDDLPVERVDPRLRSAVLSGASLQAAVRKLRDPAVAGSQVAGLRGGVVRLVDALAAELDRFGVRMRVGARVAEADPAGVSLDDGERLAGVVVIAAPGVVGDAPRGRRVKLVTLVVDAPELDAAPRGTGVLVVAGSDVAARALTHVTAKWPWVAELAQGRHVLRLSYDDEPGATDANAVERATRDASALLGQTLPAPEDAAVVTWERAAPRTHSVDGMHYVGESVSGTGIAAVVTQADAISVDRPENDAEPQG
jgi:oxygen-dependent protoporphyrinogen oxidase